jgi:hypothetical protein
MENRAMSQHSVAYVHTPSGGLRHGGSRTMAANVEALPDGGVALGGSAIVVAPPVAHEAGSAGGAAVGGVARAVVRRAGRPCWIITQGFMPRQWEAGGGPGFGGTAKVWVRRASHVSTLLVGQGFGM